MWTSKGDYTSDGLSAIASALASSPCLTRLDLSQNSLGVAYVDGVRVNSMHGIVSLAEAVAASTSLRELIIGYNSLGPTAGRAIGEAAARSRLSMIDISGNLIGLKGARAICDAVQARENLSQVTSLPKKGRGTGSRYTVRGTGKDSTPCTRRADPPPGTKLLN